MQAPCNPHFHLRTALRKESPGKVDYLLLLKNVKYLKSEVFSVPVVSVKDQEPARNFLHWFDAAKLGTLAVHFPARVEGWDVPVAACADVDFLDLQVVRILNKSSI